MIVDNTLAIGNPVNAQQSALSGRPVVLVPVKQFGQAKHRLSEVLSTDERAELARKMAEHVLAAAYPLPCAVVCETKEVAEWAERQGALALERPSLGLNRAVTNGVERLFSLGASEVIVVHSDLPGAREIAELSGYEGITIVPDRTKSGTNVICIPHGCRFDFSYGKGSFQRHLDQANRSGFPVRVILDVYGLSLDIDLPKDLYEALEAGLL